VADQRPADWTVWVEEVARLLAAPPLRRGDQTLRGPEDPKFLIGDYLVNIPESQMELLAVELDVDPAQLRVYREVAGKIPPAQRVRASWTVHRDLRDRQDLLRDGLTVRAAAAAAGKRPIDSKADRRLSVEDRATKVRDFLADPDVYSVIEQDMARSRQERRVRHGARLIHEDLAKQEKLVQTELRESRETKSALEATLKAQVDLLRAAQLVHAIGETLAELPEFDRLIGALSDLRDEVDRVLDECVSTDESVVIIDAEVWQDRTARAAIAGSDQRSVPQSGQAAVIDISD
jgi:hypothetical protein